GGNDSRPDLRGSDRNDARSRADVDHSLASPDIGGVGIEEAVRRRREDAGDALERDLLLEDRESAAFGLKVWVKGHVRTPSRRPVVVSLIGGSRSGGSTEALWQY